MTDLRKELAEIPAPLRAHLDSAGFDAERLIRLARELGGTLEEAAARRDARNRVRGGVRAPSPSEVPPAPGADSREAKLGEEALRRGELAFVVLSGGMATRMGGVVKALVEAVPGHTFLDLRLRGNAAWSKRAGKDVPLWLMTSEATHAPLGDALAKAHAPPHVATFMQDVGLRLTPEGHLFRGDDGAPSTYAPGHGDVVDALRRSGLLRRFREAGGKVVWIANLDNLGATIDPAILGAFLASGRDVMVEVAPKVAGDRGGIPVWATTTRDGVERLQVLEEFRLPAGFDASTVRVFNTNTFLVRAEALDTVDVEWSWFEVEKKADGRTAVQFERLLQEITAALPTAYVTVPRDGEASRFLPVKDNDELAKRRGEIDKVARARGMM
jgi:UTP--glucose-1-phosphate uridylyltransferase